MHRPIPLDVSSAIQMCCMLSEILLLADVPDITEIRSANSNYERPRTRIPRIGAIGTIIYLKEDRIVFSK